MINNIDQDLLQDPSLEPMSNKPSFPYSTNELIADFKTNKQNSKSYRQLFEKEWVLIDTYLWNDTYKINKGIIKKSLFGSTNNILLTVFNYRLANLLINNSGEGITVTPGFLNTKVLDLDSPGITPEAQNEIDKKVVDFILKVDQFKDVLKFYWEDLNIDEVNKNIFFDYLIYGTGIGELYWDEYDHSRHDDGDLKLYYVPLFSFFLEPYVTNWQESRYVIVSEVINLLNLQATFNLSNDEIKKISKEVGTNTSNNDINLLNNQPFSTTYNQTVPYYRYYKKYLNSNNEVKISCTYFVGEQNPQLIKTVEDIGIDFFPFSVLFSYKKPTDSYGQSVFKFLLPAQKMIIQQDAIIQLRSAQAANPLVLVSSSSGINIEQLSNKGGVSIGTTYVVDGDISKAMAVVKLNEIPQDSISYIQLLQNSMNIMANTTDASTGRTAISGAGSGAVQQNSMNASLPFKIQQSEIQTYYHNLLQLIVKLLIAKQTTARQLFIKNSSSQDFKYKTISYKMDYFKDIHKQIKINIKATSQQDLEKERQIILQLFQMAAQYPDLKGAVSAIDVIRALHLSNEDELIAKIQIQEDMDYEEIAMQIIQLVQQNDQTAIQAQQKQSLLQAAQMSGQMDPKEIQESASRIPQPLDPNILLQIIVPLIKGNPAASLENEKNIQQSAMNSREQSNGS